MPMYTLQQLIHVQIYVELVQQQQKNSYRAHEREHKSNKLVQHWIQWIFHSVFVWNGKKIYSSYCFHLIFVFLVFSGSFKIWAKDVHTMNINILLLLFSLAYYSIFARGEFRSFFSITEMLISFLLFFYFKVSTWQCPFPFDKWILCYYETKRVKRQECSKPFPHNSSVDIWLIWIPYSFQIFSIPFRFRLRNIFFAKLTAIVQLSLFIYIFQMFQTKHTVCRLHWKLYFPPLFLELKDDLTHRHTHIYADRNIIC